MNQILQDLRLFDWYKESSDSYSAEIIDEDWIPMFPEPDICKKLPETGIDTSTMQRSLCPWQWRFALIFLKFLFFAI